MTNQEIKKFDYSFIVLFWDISLDIKVRCTQNLSPTRVYNTKVGNCFGGDLPLDSNYIVGNESHIVHI